MQEFFYNTIDLRCEDLVDPLGIDVAYPRLSWRMDSNVNGAAQTAYRVLCATDKQLLTQGIADLWDSGKISTDQSQHIKYNGKPLSRGIQCFWTVRVWNENDVLADPSTPSFWSYFNMGSDHDWQAKWITDETSSPWFRQTMQLKTLPNRAMIYINAIGYFQLFINNTRVENDEFTPHIGQYDKRTFCITYDVTQYLKKGINGIGLWMGSGWNKEGAGVALQPCVRAQLEMVDINDKITTLTTDENWRAHPSSMSYLGKWCWNNFGGEEHRGAQDLPNWASADFDDSDWSSAKLAKVPNTRVTAEMVQRNRVIETIHPLSITKLKPNAWLVDMGKAMTGTFEIQFPKGLQGHVVTMAFGDHYEANIDGSIGEINNFRQSSDYVLRGEGNEVFKNRFNYASFQYVLITNAPEGDIKPENITGSLITTDLPKASSFSCSNTSLNKIHQMMEHTLRCLMLGGYQVDCHSRERYGYGGDGQSSLDTTLSLFRSDSLYRKWTQDWLDGQKEDGGLTYTSPSSNHGGGPFWCGFLPAATLKHYHHYGDIELVRRNYPAIKKWIELAQSKTLEDLQEQFCGGWYLGDWASPKGLDDKGNAQVFIHAYMAYVLEQTAQLAEIIGKTTDATTFRQWAMARNKATHKKFYNPKSMRYGSGDQVTYILPLIAEVVPKDLLDKVFSNFEEKLMQSDNGHLATGLSGTYMMIQYLQNIDRHDLIYSFVSKNTYPSWSYMIENGATATWEHWDGKESRIHNCYNNVGSWFIQGLAGIRPDLTNPGFKNVIIKPSFIRDLDYVNGSHDSIYGTIRSNWKRVGHSITLKVTIPANSTATIYIPIKTPNEITVNSLSITDADYVVFAKFEKNNTILKIASGNYEFCFKN